MPYEQPSVGRAPSSMYRRSMFYRLPRWVKYIALPLVVGFTGTTFVLVSLRLAPLPAESLATPTLIDSADGKRLADWTIQGTHAEHVSLKRIPMALQEATLAVEDADFYTHHAFNPVSIARAMLVDIGHLRIVEGGSTITQQLAKNLYLTQDRTITRKLREALYAIQLELHETKPQILEQYLNVIYYGNGAYGVQSAAKLYFNKPVESLTPAESTFLAGLPKGPSYYSPLTHFKVAKLRQRTVLDRMVITHKLSPGEADAIYRTPLHITKVQRPLVQAPYFTVSAVQEVEHKYHLSSETLYAGDVSVTTTLDELLQQAAERALETSLPKNSHIQAALVALNPHTGAIKAMVGGRNFITSPYNRVFAERQPGSTFKAILYTTALEHGWTPANQINSTQTTFLYDKSKTYTVHDYGDFYANRPLTLREALARSDNVYAVTTNLNVGPENVIQTARKMGITSPLSPYPSLALGVFPVSPLEMATAYATLANGGYRIAPYTVEEVRAARQGEVFRESPSQTPVVSPQIAYQMSDLLTAIMKPHGTGYGVHQYMHGLASAKTGTTDTDAWMVGYTPNLVTAVWVGYDDNRPLSMMESHLAGPIWAKFMGTAQAHLPSDWFQPPAGLVKRVIDPSSGKLATDTCATTEVDYYNVGTEPTETCPLHPSSLSPAHAQTNPWYRRWLPRWLS